MKKRNNSSLGVLIFVILKFRKPSRSILDHSMICIPPKHFQFQKFQEFLICKIKKLIPPLGKSISHNLKNY